MLSSRSSPTDLVLDVAGTQGNEPYEEFRSTLYSDVKGKTPAAPLYEEIRRPDGSVVYRPIVLKHRTRWQGYKNLLQGVIYLLLPLGAVVWLLATGQFLSAKAFVLIPMAFLGFAGLFALMGGFMVFISTDVIIDPAKKRIRQEILGFTKKRIEVKSFADLSGVRLRRVREGPNPCWRFELVFGGNDDWTLGAARTREEAATVAGRITALTGTKMLPDTVLEDRS